MTMVDMINPINWCVGCAQDGSQRAFGAGKKACDNVVVISQNVVGITAEMCKDVGGLRAIAGAISATVNALDLFGAPVAVFMVLAKTCDGVNKGFGGIHVINRVNEFATGKAYSSTLYLASRVAFLVKDTLSFVTFLEGLALISAGTAKGCFENISEHIGFTVTSQSISPTFEYVGWGLDAMNNFVELKGRWQEEGLSCLAGDLGFRIALDLTKLTAITLASSNVVVFKAIRFGALFGTSAVHITRAIERHVSAQARRSPDVAPPADAPPAIEYVAPASGAEGIDAGSVAN
jgi:hypothetical protein